MFAYCRNNPVKRKDVTGTDDVCVTDGEDDNPFNDVYYGRGGAGGGGNGSGGGGNSSGGTGDGGKPCSVNRGYSNPTKSSGQSNSKVFTQDQQAVIELAKEHKNGLPLADAKILVGWANEYGIPYHGPMIHSGRAGIWGSTLHIKIKNYHIAVYL